MKQTLIKITDDHYVVVDDSEIKVGDWITDKYKVWEWNDDCSLLGRKKITHSTNIITNGMGILYLSEVKELIGEVDVEKNMWYERNVQNPYSSDSLLHTGFNKGFELGYTQALEDSKEKKYTEEDVIRIVEKSRETGLTAEYLILSLQPKTEWEVEFDENGKLKLKE